MEMKIAKFLNQQMGSVTHLPMRYDAAFFKQLAEKRYGFKSYPLETWQDILKNFKQMLVERIWR